MQHHNFFRKFPLYSFVDYFCTNLHSSLFRFLLAGESESQGEVARMHGAKAKRGMGKGNFSLSFPAPLPCH